MRTTKGGKVKVYDTPEDKEEVKRLLDEKEPMVVFFYMEGCPHCEKTKPAFDDAETGDLPKIEVEASATPEEAEVSGFPTLKKIDKEGKEVTTTGEKTESKEIEKELEIEVPEDTPKKDKGGRRRRSRRRTHRKRSTRRKGLSRKLR